MHPTYTWLAKDVAFGVNVERGAGLPPLNTPLVLFNGLKNACLDILSYSVIPQHYTPSKSGAVASPPPFESWRISAVSGGAAGVQTAFDSASPLPSQVVGRAGCSITRGSCMARHSIAVAGGLHGSTLPSFLSYTQGLQAPKTGTCSPIVLREGEGFALLPSAEMTTTLTVGASGPYTVSITVRNDADDSQTVFVFQGQRLSPASDTAIGAVFNGNGSGVVLSIIDVEVVCASVPGSNVAMYDMIPWAAYIANAMPRASDAGSTVDESALIVPSDSAFPLPAGIVAATGAMPHQSSESPWLFQREESGFYALPIFAGGTQHEVPSAIARGFASARLKSVSILAIERLRTPIRRTLATRALSIMPGSGFALGTGWYSRVVQLQVGTSGASMFAVADVEITFQVRPRVARRIIGATSIRGVA